MSAAAAAVVGGAGLLGAAITSSSAQNAASQQRQAADAANQMQYTQYQQQRADQAPWLQSGQQNLAALNTALPDLTRKFTAADFQQDPGYQFQLQQGQEAIQRSAAAKGFLNSTGTMKNLDSYSQGVANQSYQTALANFTANQQQRYNMLAGLANTGQVSAQNLGQAGQNFAGQFGGNLNAGANAGAAGTIAQGNAFNSAIGTGANAYMNGSMMNRLFPQSPTPNPTPNYPLGGPSSGGGTGYLGVNTTLTD